MSSKCYWCESGKTGKVHGAIGNIAEPLGCCKQCQVFACGHHALRNSQRMEYKCYQCLVIKLIDSAISDDNFSATEKRNMRQFDPELISGVTQITSKFKSFYEFEQEWPEFKELFATIRQIRINWEEWPAEVAFALRKLPREQELLLIMAGYILNEVEGDEGISSTAHPFRHALVQSIHSYAS